MAKHREQERPYGEGYYEIQKLNSQLVNYQRTLAKANAQLKRLLDESREAQSTIDLLEHDALTGLPTEKAFYKRAADLMAAHPNTAFDVVSLDVTRFKVVNDAFGTATADRLLADLSAFLQEACPAQPRLLTRARADTFFALVPHEETDYDQLARSMDAFLNAHPLPMRIEVKLGVYRYTEQNLPVARACDRALLAAASIKDSFNSTLAFFDESMRERMMHEQSIVDTMAASLERGEFMVHLQPKVELGTGAFVGAEALVRWNHPALGMIPPGDFIPVFERNGFVNAMDRFVWRRSCEIMRDWKQTGAGWVPISVNVSRTDLYRNDLPDVLLNLVKEHGLNPCDLHLEITETARIEDTDHLLSMAEALHRAGFPIEMDDFGSGYSSLASLSELPIDVLKLDLGFLGASATAARRRAVVRAVIGLADDLGLQVIAEGVETPHQAHQLASMGCRYAQGYLFGRPVCEEAFRALLAGKGKK